MKLNSFTTTITVAASMMCAVGRPARGEWVEAFSLPGLNGSARSSVVFDDGTGDALYVAGAFSFAGNASATFIAKWDGSTWSALGSGVNNVVNALTVFDDGGGPALYAGGFFTTAGGVSAQRIAKWDGSTWSALGTGVNNVVRTLTVFDDGGGPALYAAGDFTTAGGMNTNYIAKWDGTTWSALGLGMNDIVFALNLFDDGGGPALYAGGNFSTAGGASANSIAKWDGVTWSALGSGMAGGDPANVSALTVFNDGGGPALYAGGQFTDAGAVPDTNNIAKWDGSTWSALGSGMDNSVYALAVFSDGGGPALYAGGQFTTAGGVNTNRIAKWDGSTWSALGLGMNNDVRALTTFDDGGGEALYAGGSFFSAGGEPNTFGIARWDGSTWSAVGTDTGLNQGVVALTVFDDGSGPALFAGGEFTTAGGISANRIAKWDGSSWSALGSGIEGGNHSVFAISVFNDGSGPALYAGGVFTMAGGTSANSIAKWNGSTWSALGSGINGAVSALAVFDDGSGPALYVGGQFTNAGGVSTLNIAKWDGSTWSVPTSSMNGTVSALTIFDDGEGPALYAGGQFSTAGGVFANRIAKWDGSTWSPLGSGLDDFGVFALTVFDDGGGAALYAGGSITTAGGVSAINIAKWDGSTWSALGNGIGGAEVPYVSSLSVFDDGSGPALYAGGEFTTAGGVSANRIAKWNGATWSSLESGIDIRVNALSVFDDGGGSALFAGGDFTSAGGVVSANIAKWWRHEDCDGNTLPDVCDLGCGVANGLCNLPGCGSAEDCNGSGVPDNCDIASLTSMDSNMNGMPDECEGAALRPHAENGATQLAIGTPTAASCMVDNDCRMAPQGTNAQIHCIANDAGGFPGTCYIAKNRYISIAPNPASAGVRTARRVSRDENGNGRYNAGTDQLLGWVVAPVTYRNTTGEPAPQMQSTIDPIAVPPPAYYVDWTDQGKFVTNIVHVGDNEICPGRTYLVQEIVLGQDVTVEANYSAATRFPTVTKWGDVLGGGAGLASQNTTNFGDALAIIQGFSAAQSVSKVWLDLEPASPNFAAVGFPDVLRCTQAIASQPYPFAGCP